MSSIPRGSHSLVAVAILKLVSRIGSTNTRFSWITRTTRPSGRRTKLCIKASESPLPCKCKSRLARQVRCSPLRIKTDLYRARSTVSTHPKSTTATSLFCPKLMSPARTSRLPQKNLLHSLTTVKTKIVKLQKVVYQSLRNFQGTPTKLTPTFSAQKSVKTLVFPLQAARRTKASQSSRWAHSPPTTRWQARKGTAVTSLSIIQAW